MGWSPWGGPRFGGSGGLSLVGFDLALFYVAVFRARGAPPPLGEGACYLFLLIHWCWPNLAFRLKKKLMQWCVSFVRERNLSKEEKEEGRRCGGVERDEESFSLRRFPPALREGMCLSALLDGGDPAVPMDG